MTLQQLLGIDWPLIQAPMAGVQGHALAVAVSNAGALGSLPCAMLGPEALRSELQALRAGTQRPFNLNFFCHAAPLPDAQADTAWRATLAPYAVELGLDANAVVVGASRAPFGEVAVACVEEFRPAVVSFHFGLPPAPLLARVRATGARILSSATTVDEALWLQAHGVDAVIAQGLEAGGHRGSFLSSDLSLQQGTFALLPQVVRAVQVPVIAAGGIADAAGVAAALALGAAGVQIGTAFMLTPEARTSALHRAALKQANDNSTTLTNIFTGRPARGIVNRYVREVGPMSTDAPQFPLAASASQPMRAAAEARGSLDFTPLWSGQAPTFAREVPTATLIAKLVEEAEAVMKRLG